jgi:hypothetical protein
MLRNKNGELHFEDFLTLANAAEQAALRQVEIEVVRLMEQYESDDVQKLLLGGSHDEGHALLESAEFLTEYVKLCESILKSDKHITTSIRKNILNALKSKYQYGKVKGEGSWITEAIADVRLMNTLLQSGLPLRAVLSYDHTSYCFDAGIYVRDEINTAKNAAWREEYLAAVQLVIKGFAAYRGKLQELGLETELDLNLISESLLYVGKDEKKRILDPFYLSLASQRLSYREIIAGLTELMFDIDLAAQQTGILAGSNMHNSQRIITDICSFDEEDRLIVGNWVKQQIERYTMATELKEALSTEVPDESIYAKGDRLRGIVKKTVCYEEIQNALKLTQLQRPSYRSRSELVPEIVPQLEQNLELAVDCKLAEVDYETALRVAQAVYPNSDFNSRTTLRSLDYNNTAAILKMLVNLNQKYRQDPNFQLLMTKDEDRRRDTAGVTKFLEPYDVHFYTERRYKAWTNPIKEEQDSAAARVNYIFNQADVMLASFIEADITIGSKSILFDFLEFAVLAKQGLPDSEATLSFIHNHAFAFTAKKSPYRNLFNSLRSGLDGSATCTMEELSAALRARKKILMELGEEAYLTLAKEKSKLLEAFETALAEEGSTLEAKMLQFLGGLLPYMPAGWSEDEQIAFATSAAKKYSSVEIFLSEIRKCIATDEQEAEETNTVPELLAWMRTAKLNIASSDWQQELRYIWLSEKQRSRDVQEISVNRITYLTSQGPLSIAPIVSKFMNKAITEKYAVPFALIAAELEDEEVEALSSFWSTAFSAANTSLEKASLLQLWMIFAADNIAELPLIIKFLQVIPREALNSKQAVQEELRTMATILAISRVEIADGEEKRKLIPSVETLLTHSGSLKILVNSIMQQAFTHFMERSLTGLELEILKEKIPLPETLRLLARYANNEQPHRAKSLVRIIESVLDGTYTQKRMAAVRAMHPEHQAQLDVWEENRSWDIPSLTLNVDASMQTNAIKDVVINFIANSHISTALKDHPLAFINVVKEVESRAIEYLTAPEKRGEIYQELLLHAKRLNDGNAENADLLMIVEFFLAALAVLNLTTDNLNLNEFNGVKLTKFLAKIADSLGELGRADDQKALLAVLTAIQKSPSKVLTNLRAVLTDEPNTMMIVGDNPHNCQNTTEDEALEERIVESLEAGKAKVLAFYDEFGRMLHNVYVVFSVDEEGAFTFMDEGVYVTIPGTKAAFTLKALSLLRSLSKFDISQILHEEHIKLLGQQKVQINFGSQIPWIDSQIAESRYTASNSLVIKGTRF